LQLWCQLSDYEALLCTVGTAWGWAFDRCRLERVAVAVAAAVAANVAVDDSTWWQRANCDSVTVWCSACSCGVSCPTLRLCYAPFEPPGDGPSNGVGCNAWLQLSARPRAYTSLLVKKTQRQPQSHPKPKIQNITKNPITRSIFTQS
jgi:hypothetical protein